MIVKTLTWFSHYANKGFEPWALRLQLYSELKATDSLPNRGLNEVLAPWSYELLD